MGGFEKWKESLKGKQVKVLDRMLFIKKTALNKKTDDRCEAGWAKTPYCGGELTDREEKLFRSNLKRTEAMLKKEIQAITDEIHSRGMKTADEMDEENNNEQPTLKF